MLDYLCKMKLFENHHLIDNSAYNAVYQCESGDPSLASSSRELRLADLFQFGLELVGSTIGAIYKRLCSLQVIANFSPMNIGFRKSSNFRRKR